ncbi:MAG: DeoR/GlpR transcriptional regulator [Chloroflexi bacterium]|jgi:DeoR/GlpR family transcriptional regulator of sugar metabolism|nr:DeoR/GlpR transcriptional regulator [Chloroflexota bacterium]
MSTFVEYRYQFILDIIEKRGSVNVIELAEALNVSDMTIRRDLRELEKSGFIRRFHGGAVGSRGRAYEPSLMTRSMENQKQKEIIGRYAAKMIVEGDSVALDVGTTAYQIAKNIGHIKNITLITPSLPIAQLFFERSDMRLILPGGIVRPGESSLIGEITRRNIEQVFVDRLFVGAGGVDIQAGVTEFNMDDALIKQALIKNAKEVILAVDASKFDKISFTHVADLNQIDQVITDAPPPEELRRYFRNQGITVHIAAKDPECQE